MGSRPPRQQPLPRAPRHARPIDARQPEITEQGLRMETITPFIGMAAVPVAVVASFLGYALSGERSAILVAVAATFLVAVGTWAVLHQMADWRASAILTNYLLVAILIGIAGTGIMLGGLAALSLPWIIAGLAQIGGAFLVHRLLTGR